MSGRKIWWICNIVHIFSKMPLSGVYFSSWSSSLFVAWHTAHKLFHWLLSTIETLIKRLHETEIFQEVSSTASFSILFNAHSCSFHAVSGSSSSYYYYCQVSLINKIKSKQTKICVVTGSKEDCWGLLVLKHRNVVMPCLKAPQQYLLFEFWNKTTRI